MDVFFLNTVCLLTSLENNLLTYLLEIAGEVFVLVTCVCYDVSYEETVTIIMNFSQ